ncbi:MAG: NAD-dependent epimerase/dehydratase family protein [Mesorhizobium sp.]|uniref:NAD-dependent epimerase/dehydratase family protein n=1 Tax=Mesorhizobium sp. TaxID=1871066 RepID=UPI000FE858FE|nr:NAD-dependent epimerase/dehydratase family protein [Mesorhizobium sp.]RWQ39621.1 MAG: NAD-dependent epimerase/dehydratase family protein [Mesorhizobium sp.]TIL27986.1 MAG: NAD-dependent epimerase/dehydratase family protein [Mesorhizobium sp.]
MKVLVTGATGFIGRLVVQLLREAQFEIRIASRHPEKLGSGNDILLLPNFDAPAEAFATILKDVTHVVHCAGLNNDRGNPTEADYLKANAELTGQLARAAAAQANGRFIYLSSTRAVVGAGFSGRLDEETIPAPQCAYGRSKREGEIRVLDAYASSGRSDAAMLRLPPVYGSGMKGNLATLMRLADTALPLPAAALAGVRSLISSEAAARAVLHLLTHSIPPRPVYIASDIRPIPVAAIIEAFRQGFGRPKRLVAVPAGLIRPVASLLGKRKFWESLTATQICDPSLLISEGWLPETDTIERLTAIARVSRFAQVR